MFCTLTWFSTVLPRLSKLALAKSSKQVLFKLNKRQNSEWMPIYISKFKKPKYVHFCFTGQCSFFLLSHNTTLEILIYANPFSLSFATSSSTSATRDPASLTGGSSTLRTWKNADSWVLAKHVMGCKSLLRADHKLCKTFFFFFFFFFKKIFKKII